MSQHDIAFTVDIAGSSAEYVQLTTHREFYDNEEMWVETVNGRVRKAEIDKAKQKAKAKSRVRYDEYGGLVDDNDDDLRAQVEELIAEKRKSKTAEQNPAALEHKATIRMPVADAVGFQTGRWYRLRFEPVDEGVSLRSFFTQDQRETAAVERNQESSRQQAAPTK